VPFFSNRPEDHQASHLAKPTEAKRDARYSSVSRHTPRKGGLCVSGKMPTDLKRPVQATQRHDCRLRPPRDTLQVVPPGAEYATCSRCSRCSRGQFLRGQSSDLLHRHTGSPARHGWLTHYGRFGDPDASGAVPPYCITCATQVFDPLWVFWRSGRIPGRFSHTVSPARHRCLTHYGCFGDPDASLAVSPILYHLRAVV